MSVFVHAQGIKTVHAGGVKKWQNSVHVVVECPQSLRHQTFQNDQKNLKMPYNIISNISE